jgi:ABC-2 type transport system ATP-binding protein
MQASFACPSAASATPEAASSPSSSSVSVYPRRRLGARGADQTPQIAAAATGAPTASAMLIVELEVAFAPQTARAASAASSSAKRRARLHAVNALMGAPRCFGAMVRGQANAVPARLELDSLTRRYGDRVAVDNLTFAVEGGLLHGFVGPNGAGKTTTMRIVMGVLAPDSGGVLLDGKPVDELSRQGFGYMPEERGLYPRMPVHAQLSYLARLHGASAADAARAADRWIERLGVAERRNDRVDALSLGNQQRVQLAAALVHEPEVLVLDEPFSGLDPVAVDALAEVLLERVRAGAAVLFSSHQLDLVERLCEVVSIIADGRLVASGRVDDLRAEASHGRLVRVLVEGAPGGWYHGLTGVDAVDADARGVVLRLHHEADDQELLDAARAAGRVRAFAPAEPTLEELFREAVSQP